jgi:hypothetical protein
MTTRRIVISGGKALVAGVIVVAIAGALRQNWAVVSRTAAHLDAAWLGGAFLICTFYRVANACGWPLVLGALRFRLPVARGARIWLVSETMRWLPGSVWGFYSRVHQARKAGVPAATASMSLPLELILTIGAWLITALVGLGSSGILLEWLSRISAARLGLAAAGALAVAATGFAIALRFPENRYAKKVRGLASDLRAVLAEGPHLPVLLATFVLYLLLCAVNGLAFYALIRAFNSAAPALGTVIGINSIGWLVGFFAICAPGGLGVREGGMTALLAPLVPLEVAIGSVLVWRLMQIIVEIACLAACLLPEGVRNARSWLQPLAPIANFEPPQHADETA